MKRDDDEMMDVLLREAMAADAPQLSPAFDDRVMQEVRPRKLSTFGVMVLAVYAVAATAIAVWVMQGIPAVSIVAGGAIGLAAAASASAYVRRLATGS